MYPIDSLAKEKKLLDRNVYHDYNFAMIAGTLRSTSERLFERSCEQNSNVKYVYKNGDSGQNYLSIVYTTQFGKQRLFSLTTSYKLKMARRGCWKPKVASKPTDKIKISTNMPK